MTGEFTTVWGVTREELGEKRGVVKVSRHWVRIKLDSK